MRSSRAVGGLALILAFVLAACGSSTSSSAPSAPATAPGATSTAAPSPASSASSTTSQTDTEWGRIWDSLPSGFPAVQGSQPSEEGTTGPASAVLVVDGVDAMGAASVLLVSLQEAGYTSVGSTDRLEDGSVVLDLTGPPEGCQVQIEARPTGSLTTITILYGATCPHE